MGVQGLWELLAPVGRRVSVETLAGRKLAIDASIWMVQFMKAMRDDKGEMIRNAHLIGFFRRICKLLYLRVKPVFVFDGGTPALKRRTVIARRRQRERAQAKIRKTAEKLLLNHLRTRKLEELAQEIKNAKEGRKNSGSKNEVQTNKNQKQQAVSCSSTPNENGNYEAGSSSQTPNDIGNYEAGDALLAATLMAEEDGQLQKLLSESPEETNSDEDEEMDGSEEMILPVNQGKIDPAVLAVLPPSMQLDLLVQMREQMMAEKRQKFQKVKKAPASFSELQIQAYLKTVAFRREIEEVQKAAAGTGIGGMPTSRIASESNREFIFSSSFTGDKRALCFPGSITSETEGRPAEKDEAPDSSSGPFSTLTSSMFSGTSVLQGEACKEDSEAPVETYINEKGQVCVSRHRGMGVRMTRDLQWNLYLMKESEELGTNASNNVKETDCTKTSQEILIDDTCQINENAENVDTVNIGYENEGLSAACTGGKKILTKDSNHLLCNSDVGGVQISFTEEDIGEQGEDDDFFTALVAGDSDACNHIQDYMHACEWEQGKIQLNEDSDIQGHFITSNFNQVSEAAPVECSVVDGDDEIEWEDGNNVAACETKIPSKSYENSSRKFPSEEEELQEAIKRSLEDFGGQNHRASCSRLIIRETSQETSENAVGVGMPLQQSTCGNDLDGTTKKVDIKDFSDVEKESKGKSQITEEDGRDCDSYKSQLKRHTNRPIQISAEKCEPIMNIAENRTKFSKNRNEFLISTPAHKKDTKDPHLITPHDMQGLVGVEEFARPMEPILSNKVHDNDELCPTIDIEILNDNRLNTLKNSEAVEAVGHHVSYSTASAPGIENNSNGKMVSNDTSISHTLYEDKVMSESHGGLTNDDLIREAEETDSRRDREALLKKEAELLAMTKENLRKKEEIEAELEAEKEDLQANVDEEMIFLRQEELDLQAAQKKHERNAESVSGEMFAECQELLQMFGLPYIIAPMEAEAQCAYLEFIHLVDGVVTDDCDVFLFGASSVYKNIFDERKYVETYLMKDIEKELGLDRDKLIRMAMLLGSDYTEGISGIGIVNAIEVVNSFPEEDGLKRFREWLDSPDPSLLDKVNACSGQNLRKRLSKSNKKTEHTAEEKEGGVILDQNTEGGEGDEASEDRNLALKKIFMAKHQVVSKNWHVPDSFPNEAVVSAYTSPQVDKATETFSWGRPDLMSLRKLCWERFGWNKEKADELLLPVLKEYDRRETQLRLEAFYSFNERFAKIRSRRIQKAVTGITGCRSSELMDLPPHLVSTSQKRPRKKKERSGVGADDNLPEQNMVDVGTEKISADVQCSGSVKGGKEARKSEADSIVKIPTGGRGRGKGKGRGGKKGASRGTRDAKNSTDESGCENEKTTSHKAQLKRKSCVDIVGIRKSTRHRKAVKYALDEQDSGSSGHSDDDMDFEMSCEALPAKESQNQPETIALPAKASQKPLETSPLPSKASKKQSQTSAYSFFREDEQTDIESNLRQTDIENPHVSFIRDERQSSDYIAIGGSFCFEEDNHGDDVHTNKENADGQEKLQRQGSENPDVGFRNERQSLDYLAAGGGFCLEEDKYGDDLHTNNNNVDDNVKPTVDNTQDTDSDILPMNSSRRAPFDVSSSEVKDLSMYHGKESYFKVKKNDDSHNGRNPKEADRIAEEKGGNHSSASAAGLRAMPFLRRRKRT